MTEKLTFAVRDGSQRCTGVALSPTGDRLAFGGGRLQVWDLDPVKEVPAFQNHADFVLCVVYNPAGTRLAGATVRNQAKVWHALTGKQLLIIQGHTREIRDIAFSPDGQRLATASEDGTAKIWDVADSEESRILDGSNFGSLCGAFSPDGKRFAIGGDSLRVCDAVSGRLICKMPGPQRSFRSLAFSPTASCWPPPIAGTRMCRSWIRPPGRWSGL